MAYHKGYPKLYNVWKVMRYRCRTNLNEAGERYFHRNITVCLEWDISYPNFLEWAIKAGYKEGLTIDRINNDGDYSPDNCRWVTAQENNLNKPASWPVYSLWGETKSLIEWGKDPRITIGYNGLRYRIVKQGMSFEEAVKFGSSKRYGSGVRYGTIQNLHDPPCIST